MLKYERSRKVYGSPRIAAILNQKGIACSRVRVARIIRANGIASKKIL
jgi:SOS response regulatory protein OraA/RecX